MARSLRISASHQRDQARAAGHGRVGRHNLLRAVHGELHRYRHAIAAAGGFDPLKAYAFRAQGVFRQRQHARLEFGTAGPKGLDYVRTRE